MIDDEDQDENQVPEKPGIPFQYQLMEWCLIILTVASLSAFFMMIVF